ncbi:MAG: peptide deformylase [Acidimicrobiales bacterium]|nr:peptide deformylase [Acidimicrobiales bacterium]
MSEPEPTPTGDSAAPPTCAPITLWGNPVLRRRAEPVTVFDASVQRLVDQLFETMYAIDSGVGLAANQIGALQRVFVFDCRDGLVGHVVNPVVEVIGPDLQDGGEGCLSLPGIGMDTVRSLRARVTGQDATGDDIAYEGEGLRARAFQHETDHLDARLYIDLHPARTRRKLEKEMRDSEWFGHHSLDPASELYRRAQGFDDEDAEPIDPVE